MRWLGSERIYGGQIDLLNRLDGDADRAFDALLSSNVSHSIGRSGFLAFSGDSTDGMPSTGCACPACASVKAAKAASFESAPPQDDPQFLGDDIGDTVGSGQAYTIGQTFVSAIDSVGDRDVFAVSLTAGVTYTFSLARTGTSGLSDAFLEIFDGSSNELAENDDGGIRLDSFMTFTPTTSGTYHLSARGFDNTNLGSYALTSGVIPSGSTSPTEFTDNSKPFFSWDQAAIQITRSGHSWATAFGVGATVTYAFRADAPTIMPSSTSGFSRYSEAQIVAAEIALRAWSEVANITFVRVGSGTSGDQAFSNSASILFANYSTGESGAAAFAYLPDFDRTGTSDVAGDVWTNSTLSYNANPAFQTYGLQVLLHEIGHAIGLRHPGDYNATGEAQFTYGVDALYHGDSRLFTTMSYFASSEAGGSVPYFAAAPQLHDIAAAQRLYGPNMNTRTGDTVYGFNSNTGRQEFTLTSASSAALFTIWDAGGNDTLDLSLYTGNSTIDLREEAFSSAGTGNGGGPAVYNIAIARGAVIENAIGGSGDDSLRGNAVSNILNGAVGNDRLFGMGGDDILIGGTGADQLDGGQGSDVASYATATGAVVASLANPASNQGDAQGDTYTGIEGLVGGDFGDTLTGDGDANQLSGLNGNDTLNGGAGADRMTGGQGDDLYFVDSEQDVLIELPGEGADTVNSVAETTFLSANIEVVYLAAGSAARNAFGNASVNALYGNSFNNYLNGEGGDDYIEGGGGDDIIDGATGNDVLVGGLGNDSYNVDFVFDEIRENVNEGFDAVYTTFNYTLGANLEALYLRGTAQNGYGNSAVNALYGNELNNYLNGEGGNDYIEGGGGDDIIDGASGNDVLVGGLGNDSYNVDVAFDEIREIAGEGFDTVYANASYTLSANVERLVLQGSDALDGTGNSADNFLDGNSGANRLNGGAGNDVLFGGGGADTFVFGSGAGNDTISDFADNVDLIDFSAIVGLSFQSLVITQVGANITIAYGGNLLTVLDATASNFTSGDFIFAT